MIRKQKDRLTDIYLGVLIKNIPCFVIMSIPHYIVDVTYIDSWEEQQTSFRCNIDTNEKENWKENIINMFGNF